MARKEATSRDIGSVLEKWWVYVEGKTRMRPDLNPAIVPTVVDGYEYDPSKIRSLRFSLVDTMAPELSGIGRLTDCDTPQVYIEGVKNSTVVVPIGDALKNPDLPLSVTGLKLEKYLKDHHLSEGDFLMYVYSTNAQDAYWKRINYLITKELFFVTDSNRDLRAFTLFQGTLNLNRIPIYRQTYLKPSSTEEVGIIRRGLDSARLIINHSAN